jgi:hypothetical protein
VPDTIDHSYEEGVRDGRIAALERRADAHDDHYGNHERRLIYIERIVVGMLAIVTFTSVGPEIMGFFNAMAK